jgi:hypothetical protein
MAYYNNPFVNLIGPYLQFDYDEPEAVVQPAYTQPSIPTVEISSEAVFARNAAAYTQPSIPTVEFSSNPLQNLRVGRVEHSLANNTIVFYHRETLDGEWLVDRWTSRQIRNQDMLLYIIAAEPGSQYHGYAMATVSRNYTMTLYVVPPSGLDVLPDPDQVPWADSISRDEARITRDPMAAARAWEHWWPTITTSGGGSPPQPPGGGAAAAAGAESRNLAEPRAQLATASLLAALLVAEAAGPVEVAQPTAVEGAAEPATGLAIDDEELATMDVASRLLLQALRRLPPSTVRSNRSIDLATSAWDSWINPLTYVTNQKSTPIPGPQKRVADLVIADAINRGATCSISMEELTKENAACVAPCYHCFEREAIQSWLRQATTCPECRADCSL